MNYILSQEIEVLIRLSDLNEEEKINKRSGVVSFETLKKLVESTKDAKSLLYYISTTKPELEKPKKAPEKTKEYIKLMSRLKVEEQEREYQSYLNKQDNYAQIDSIGVYSFRDAKTEQNAGRVAKEANHYLTTVVNILVTTVSVGYAVWYWTGSSMRASVTFRMLLSIFASLLVLVAEVVIFGGYMRKVEEARTKERNKIEVKEVVESYVFGRSKALKGKEAQELVQRRLGSSGIQRHG